MSPGWETGHQGPQLHLAAFPRAGSEERALSEQANHSEVPDLGVMVAAQYIY